MYRIAVKDTTGQDEIRWKCYAGLTAPTSRAAHYHALRIYLEVYNCHHLIEESLLEPTDWGWQVDNRKMVPIMTDLIIIIEFI